MKLLLSSLLCAVLPFTVMAETVGDLQPLQRMNTAIHSLNYHGTIIYLHDGQMDSLRVIHKFDGTNESERVVQLTGHAGEVVRANDLVSCFLACDHSVIVAEQQGSNRLITNVEVVGNAFSDHYQLTSMDEIDRVAGRNATVIKIEPNDGLRYGYRLWLDEQTGLLLRSELLGAQGQVLEQFMFAELTIVDSIPQQMLEPGIAVKETNRGANRSPVTPPAPIDSHWQVTAMPSGFSLLAHFSKPLAGSTVPAEHLVVGDGLASVSIYIESIVGQTQPIVGNSKLGAVNMLGTVLDNHQLTVVGEVPAVTIRMIAESVRYQVDH